MSPETCLIGHVFRGRCEGAGPCLARVDDPRPQGGDLPKQILARMRRRRGSREDVLKVMSRRTAGAGDGGDGQQRASARSPGGGSETGCAARRSFRRRGGARRYACARRVAAASNLSEIGEDEAGRCEPDALRAGRTPSPASADQGLRRGRRCGLAERHTRRHRGQAQRSCRSPWLVSRRQRSASTAIGRADRRGDRRRARGAGP